MPAHTRPTSPHLSIYKFTITMAMSIVHRITGIALYVGTIVLVVWLGAAAIGAGPVEAVQGFFGTWIGQFVLFGYGWALIHHLLGGIRYFIWDSGLMMTPGRREALAWANLIGSVVLTLVVFGVFVWFGGR